MAITKCANSLRYTPLGNNGILVTEWSIWHKIPCKSVIETAKLWIFVGIE